MPESTASMKYLYSILTALVLTTGLAHAQVTVTGQSITRDNMLKLGRDLQRVVVVKSSATPTLDLSQGSMFSTVLTANATFAITSPNGAVISGRRITLQVAQDGTGSRTVTWPSVVHWSGGSAPTQTATASKTDVYEFIYNGTNWLGKAYGQNY